MPRILKISFIIAIILALALATYLFFKPVGDQISPPDNGGGSFPIGSTSSVPITSDSGGMSVSLERVSDFPLFSFWETQTREIYYLTQNGEVYAAKSGADVEIFSQEILALNSLESSPKQTRALVAYGDPHNPRWIVFDTIDKTWRPLPQEIKVATWGDTDSVLFAMVDTENGLGVMKVDISKNPPAYQVLLKDFRIRDVSLLHTTTSTLLFIEKPSSYYQSSVWELNLSSLKIALYGNPEFGFSLRENPYGNEFFSFATGGKLLFTGQDGKVQQFIFSTLPEKCAANSNTVYCFVPRDPAIGATLPDDYISHKYYSIDNMFIVDRTSGLITPIQISALPNVPHIDATNVTFTNGSVYFLNRYDRGLYRLTLDKKVSPAQ